MAKETERCGGLVEAGKAAQQTVREKRAAMQALGKVVGVEQQTARKLCKQRLPKWCQECESG